MPDLNSRRVTATPRRGAPIGVPFPALRHIPIPLTGLGALALCTALGPALGARSVPLPTVADALFGDAQGITRNPLASPTTLAHHPRHQRGCRFRGGRRDLRAEAQRPRRVRVVRHHGCRGRRPLAQAQARRAGDIDPVRLALGGTVLQLVTLSRTSALMLLNRRTLDEARFWPAGSLSGRALDTLWPVLPTLLLSPEK